MDRSKVYARVKYFIAIGGLLVALAWTSLGSAQQFNLPGSFAIPPGADTARSEDWTPLTIVQPIEGPFSELSTILLRTVRSEVTTPDIWLTARLTAQISDRAFAHHVLNSSLRQKLLNSSHQHLEVFLTSAKINVHIDGYVDPTAKLYEMIEIAAMLANNCG